MRGRGGFRRQLLLVTLVGWALAGCAGDERVAAGLDAVIDTLDGVERVSYPATPAVQLRWALDTVALIGDAFGEEAYQLGEVWSGGLAGDAAGHVYVMDRMASRVLRYGPDGRYVGSFGGRGQGPGEIKDGIHLRRGPGDSLWVADHGNNRMTAFSPAGGDARSVPLPQGLWPQYGLILGDEAMVMGARPILPLQGGEAPERREEALVPVVRMDYQGNMLDTIWSAPAPPMDELVLEAGGEVIVALAARAFAPTLHLGMFSDGSLALADAAEYRVAMLSPRGALSRWLERAPAPLTTTPAHREAEREATRRREARSPRANQPGMAQLAEQRVAKMTFADVIPRIVRMAVDAEDRLWVGVSENTPGEVERIDVYDRAGTLLGEVRGMPFPHAFSGADRIEVLDRDELDVQRVLVMRVVEQLPSAP